MTYILHDVEQVASSAKAIGELQFAPPGIFTNALLGKHEITNLIRDTEPHEQALFSVENEDGSNLARTRSTRRTTRFTTDQIGDKASAAPFPRKQSAVARVLGTDVLKQMDGYQGQKFMTRSNASKPVDIEMLLKGAERLCAVYPIAGAADRIVALRKRHTQTAESIATYETLVASQTARLDQIRKDAPYEQNFAGELSHDVHIVTDEELQAEEREIRELERKKMALDEQVASMEKDLGGLR